MCAYDRAGEGHSSSLPAHDSFEAMVRDLHALLEAAGIEGPYVVMGHSFGGRLIPHFANLYPNDVVGMVLLDPGHEAFSARAEAALKPLEWQQYLEASGGRISDFEEAQGPGDLGAPGDFPLVVISAAHAIDRPGVSSEVNEKLYDLLVGLHREMVALSPKVPISSPRAAATEFRSTGQTLWWTPFDKWLNLQKTKGILELTESVLPPGLVFSQTAHRCLRLCSRRRSRASITGWGRMDLVVSTGGAVFAG